MWALYTEEIPPKKHLKWYKLLQIMYPLMTFFTSLAFLANTSFRWREGFVWWPIVCNVFTFFAYAITSILIWLNTYRVFARCGPIARCC